jgi:hypothetical protein
VFFQLLDDALGHFPGQEQADRVVLRPPRSSMYIRPRIEMLGSEDASVPLLQVKAVLALLIIPLTGYGCSWAESGLVGQAQL